MLDRTLYSTPKGNSLSFCSPSVLLAGISELSMADVAGAPVLRMDLEKRLKSRH